MAKLAAVVAALACALSLVALTKQAPSKGVDEVAAAKAYIQGIAKQNSLKIDRMKVLAVRETGDQAIVRVQITYHPYLAIDAKHTIKGPESTIVLSVHLTKTGWYAQYGAVQ